MILSDVNRSHAKTDETVRLAESFHLVPHPPRHSTL